MRTLAALDLREVRLADSLARLGVNAFHQFLLREGAIHAAEGTFDLAEVANFFSQRHICHIAIIVSQFEISSRTGLVLFAMTYVHCFPGAKDKKPPPERRLGLREVGNLCKFSCTVSVTCVLC